MLTQYGPNIGLLGGVYCLKRMTCSPLNNNYISQFELWIRTPLYVSILGFFGNKNILLYSSLNSIIYGRFTLFVETQLSI